MKFSEALLKIEEKEKLTREGWNGANQYVYLFTPPEFNFVGDYQLPSYLCIKTSDNKLVPWLPSQTDIFADDWKIYKDGTGTEAKKVPDSNLLSNPNVVIGVAVSADPESVKVPAVNDQVLVPPSGGRVYIKSIDTQNVHLTTDVNQSTSFRNCRFPDSKSFDIAVPDKYIDIISREIGINGVLFLVGAPIEGLDVFEVLGYIQFESKTSSRFKVIEFNEETETIN